MKIWNKLTNGKKFEQGANCRNNLFSFLSNSAWLDIKSEWNTLKLQDMCSNPKYKCRKQICFTRRRYQLEGVGFQNKTEKVFKRSQTAGKEFLKTAINATVRDIGLVLAAKPKNSAVVPATTKKLKSTSGGKVSSLTHMHGNGF